MKIEKGDVLATIFFSLLLNFPCKSVAEGNISNPRVTVQKPETHIVIGEGAGDKWTQFEISLNSADCSLVGKSPKKSLSCRINATTRLSERGHIPRTASLNYQATGGKLGFDADILSEELNLNVSTLNSKDEIASSRIVPVRITFTKSPYPTDNEINFSVPIDATSSSLTRVKLHW